MFSEVIMELDELIRRIKNEGLTLILVSCGGCGSNSLSKCLETNGFKVRTPIWHKSLCHYPKPFETTLPVIYLYRDLTKAFTSQKIRGRGYWDVNQYKLTNTVPEKLSDEFLKDAMRTQYERWKAYTDDETKTHKSVNKRLFISLEECLTSEGRDKLETFLGKKLEAYPFLIT